MNASHTKLVTDDHCFEIHRLMMAHSFRLAGIFERMKFTVYFAADTDFVTTDTPVIRVFTSELPLGYGMQRPDIEVRFPLSRRAFLTLTHDMKLAGKIRNADERTRKRLLAATPEIKIRYVSSAQVRAFNRGHVRHAHRWIFASGELDWASELLAQPSVAPKVLDLSTRDLMHFQSLWPTIRASIKSNRFDKSRIYAFTTVGTSPKRKSQPNSVSSSFHDWSVRTFRR